MTTTLPPDAVPLTLVDVPSLKVRLSNIGVHWKTCPKWKTLFNQLYVYGSQCLQHDSCEALFTYGVPTNKLSLLLSIHPILDKLCGRILNGDTQGTPPLTCEYQTTITSQCNKAIMDAWDKDIQDLGIDSTDPRIGFEVWLLEVPPIGYGRSYPDPMGHWLSKTSYERKSQRGLRSTDFRPWRLLKAKEIAQNTIRPKELIQTQSME